MTDRTPVYLLTGFLGSGKTTMLNYLLNNSPKGKKVAVVVNEFGKVSIDGPIIREEGYEVAELVSGCICCTLKSDMVRMLLNIQERKKPDLIIIEPTGLADPEELAISIRAQKSFDFRAIYGLVSSASFLEVRERVPIVEEQLKSAQTILITKCDLTDDATKQKVSEAIKTDISHAPQFFITNGAIDSPLLFPELYGATTNNQTASLPDTQPAHDTCSTGAHQSDFVSMVVKAEQTIKRADLETIFEKWKGSIVRSKGMVRTENGIELFQWSLDGFSWVPWKDIAEPALVLITDKKEAGNIWLDAVSL
ncbi:MAG: GTP-binding protein, partial [Fibrobacteres bacterium]|nr:GTP-binding protein [Fibrobacterota bacterium]